MAGGRMEGNLLGVGEVGSDGQGRRLRRRQVVLAPGSSHVSPYSRTPSTASSATETLRL